MTRPLLILLLLSSALAARSSSSGKGIPCGNSYIAANTTCHISTSSSTPVAPTVPTTFTSCAEAALYGRHDIPSSDPAYSAALDRDHDGIACESGSGSSASAPPVAPLSAPTPVTTPALATPTQVGPAPTITEPARTTSATLSTTCAKALAALDTVAVRTRPSVNSGENNWSTLAVVRPGFYVSSLQGNDTVTVMASCAEADGQARLALTTTGQTIVLARVLNISLLGGVATATR